MKTLTNSNDKFKPKTYFVAVLLIIANVIIFTNVMRVPVIWQHREVVFLNFFWSANLTPSEPTHIHTGLHKKDWLKPLLSGQTDSNLRLRVFSNLTEMLSFKFWQSLGIASYKNYTFILLHLINTLLIGILLYHFSKNIKISILSILLFLNSGIAFSTLLYPFRNAKFLLSILFIIAWLVILNTKSKNLSAQQTATFFLILLLALLSDEMTVFIFTIPFFYILINEGGRGLFNKKMIIGVICTIIVFVGISIPILSFVSKNNPHIASNLIKSSANTLISTLPHFSAIYDNFNAFFFFFCRRHFGHWDFSMLGILSIGAIVFMIYLLIVHFKKLPPLFALSTYIIGLIILKGFLMPHPFGFHHEIMPKGTAFPSLLFFGHYYTYIDSTLLIIAVGLLLTQVIHMSNRLFVTFLLLITVMNLSNAAHSFEGIEKLIKNNLVTFQGKPLAQILSMQHQLPQEKGPVYLSFPSGSQDTFVLTKKRDLTVSDSNFRRQQLIKSFPMYCSILPVQYLRKIENGELIISLNNAQPKNLDKNINELSLSRFFYDVRTKELFDLNIIRKKYSDSEFMETTINQEPFRTNLALKSKTVDVIFFVKGAATIELTAKESKNQLRQNYGQSYQLFKFTAESETLNLDRIMIKIEPATPDNTVKILGPFLIGA